MPHIGHAKWANKGVVGGIESELTALALKQKDQR
jgi:hypothetical protein